MRFALTLLVFLTAIWSAAPARAADIRVMISAGFFQVYSSLLPYTFLVVGHIEANGKREANAILSQRRADAIREILVNTFKISAKRIQSVGLGEEQLLDAARPNAPVNNQIQIMTLSKIPETEAPAAATPAAKKQPAKKKR